MTRLHRPAAVAILLGGLAAAGAAAAQDGPMGGPMDHPRGIAFEVIDADGDGMLSRVELLARATERLAAVDTNGDGALDRAEIIVAMPGPHGAFVHLFSEDPAEARADRMLAMMGGTESGRVEITALAERRVNDLLAWVDADHDAAISLEEAEAVQARRAERMSRHLDGGRRGEGRERDRD